MCCPLWPPCPQDPSHGQHLHAGSPTLIHTYLCGSMSFTSDTWGFIHMRLFILAWLPNLRLLWWVSTEEARGRSRGCSAWCLWSAMGNRRGYDALVTQECGDRMGQWGFPPCGHIQAVLIVQGGKMEEICAQESVHSNQIPLAYHYCHYHHYLHQEQHEMWVLWLPVENSVMWNFCGGYAEAQTVSHLITAFIQQFLHPI